MRVMVLCILIVILLIQCNAYKKVATDTNRTQQEREILAKVCAVDFPPRIEYKEGKVIIDSAGYKQLQKEVQDALDQAAKDYAQLADYTTDMIDSSSVGQLQLGEAKEKVASLQRVVDRLKRGIPCPDVKRVDTVSVIDKDTQYKIANLEAEIIAKNVQLKEKDEKISALEEQKNKGWLWVGILILAILAYVVLKIKFKFIP